MKVLLDVNVLLDVLADREPFSAEAAALLDLVEQGAIDGIIAAHTVTTLFYFLERDLGAKEARRILLDVLRLVDVIAVDEDRLLQALAFGWDDFEDAVQAACAVKGEADFIATRDRKGFAGSDVEPISPAQLVVRLQSG